MCQKNDVPELTEELSENSQTVVFDNAENTDLLIRKYSGRGAHDDIEDMDKRSDGFTLKQFISDFLALSFMCVLSFLLAVLSSKYSEKKYSEYESQNIEIVGRDEEDEVSSQCESVRSSNMNIHACGDSASCQNVPMCDFSLSEFSQKKFFMSRKRPRKVLSRYCQNIHADEIGFERADSRWLIRRTRSGQIYGKYPL